MQLVVGGVLQATKTWWPLFIIAGVISPPDVMSMCVFAAPMLILYFISIGVAYLVHPMRRNRNAIS